MTENAAISGMRPALLLVVAASEALFLDTSGGKAAVERKRLIDGSRAKVETEVVYSSG